MDFKQALEQRRSCYSLEKTSPISDDQLMELLELATRHTPTAFNSQSSRVMLLLGEHHDRLWDIVLESLRPVVPAEQFASTQNKIDRFKAAYGTILYFEDTSITKALQEQFSLYADNFPIWAEQANGMLQFALWTLLQGEGLGASLQHYNPLMDSAVQQAFAVPEGWRLVAQMPFGTPAAPPDPKEFVPIETRVKLLK